MALKRSLRIGVSAVLIAGRGRFEMRDLGPRGFGVAVWIASDAAPRLIALSEHDWTALGPDVTVRLAPRRGPVVGSVYARVCFEAPRDLKIYQTEEDIPIIDEEQHDEE